MVGQNIQKSLPFYVTLTIYMVDKIGIPIKNVKEFQVPILAPLGVAETDPDQSAWVV